MAKDPRSRYRDADAMIRAVEGETVPIGTSVDDATQPVESEPTLLGAAALPTEVLASPAAAEATRVFERPTAQRQPDGTRSRVMALIVGSLAVLGVVLFLAFGNRGADPSVKPPVATTGAVRARPTVTAAPATTPSTRPTTQSTRPKKENGGGHGNDGGQKGGD